jgi:hypothetical protein
MQRQIASSDAYWLRRHQGSREQQKAKADEGAPYHLQEVQISLHLGLMPFRVGIDLSPASLTPSYAISYLSASAKLPICDLFKLGSSAYRRRYIWRRADQISWCLYAYAVAAAREGTFSLLKILLMCRSIVRTLILRPELMARLVFPAATKRKISISRIVRRDFGFEGERSWVIRCWSGTAPNCLNSFKAQPNAISALERSPSASLADPMSSLTTAWW